MPSGREVIKVNCSFLKKRIFPPLGSACGTAVPRNREESLFASFSSEKEDSFLGLI
jgi:hypothetical protein